MDKDQIIQSLSSMLQKRNNDIINLELQVSQLTAQLEASKKEETPKKDENKSEKNKQSI
jgi:hypothetical protein